MIRRCDIEAAGTIEWYFYGELREPERSQVQRHLVLCPLCRQALDDLEAISAALAARDDVASPAGGDWSGFTAGLDARLRAEAPVRPSRVAPVPGGRTPARRWTAAAAVLATAAVLVLIAMGVLTLSGGRQPGARTPGLEPGTPALTEALPAASPPAAHGPVDPALASVSGQHFARSKLVVLGLATRETTGSGEDWGYERDLASSLLSDTRLYRMAAEDRGMTSLAGVMRDLELVFLEASMTPEPDDSALEQMQRLIRRRDLVTKLNAAHVDMAHRTVPGGIAHEDMRTR